MLPPHRTWKDLGESKHALEHPKLFVDPQTGMVHLLYVDITTCLFGIVQFELVSVEEEELPSEKRRRHVGIWRTRATVAVRQDIRLGAAKFGVGHNLTVVMYWDADRSLEHVTLRQHEGWSAIRSLKITGEIDFQSALEMIMDLSH